MPYYSKTHFEQIYCLWKRHSLLATAVAVGLGLGTTVQAGNLPLSQTTKLRIHVSHGLPKGVGNQAQIAPVTTPTNISASIAPSPNRNRRPKKSPALPIRDNKSISASNKLKSNATAQPLAVPKTRGLKQVLSVPGRTLFQTPTLSNRLQMPKDRSSLPTASLFGSKAQVLSKKTPGFHAPLTSLSGNAEKQTKNIGAFGSRIPVLNMLPSAKFGDMANKAKDIAELSAKMKQLDELKKLQGLQNRRNLFNPLGQPQGDQQDCTNNPTAGCLLDTGKKLHSPSGDPQPSTVECLQAGGDPATCAQGGGQDQPAGSLNNGPKDPGEVVNNRAGRGPAKQDGGDQAGGNTHGKFLGWDTVTGTRNADGSTTTTRMGNNEDGTTVRQDTRTTTDGSESTETSITTRDRSGAIVDHTEVVEYHFDDGSTTTFVHYNEGTDREMNWQTYGGGSDNPASQSTPEGSNTGGDKGCYGNSRSLITGKCILKRPTGRGMTSQPGPDGNSGDHGQDNSIAPNIGPEAITNCGDAGSEFCNQGSAGRSSGGQPVDMLDPGGAFGGVGSIGGVSR